MSLPFSLLLIPYAIFLLIWFFLSLTGYYHLFRFGGRRVSTFLLGLIYFIGCVVIFQVSYLYVQEVNWQETVSIFSGALPINFIEFSN